MGVIDSFDMSILVYGIRCALQWLVESGVDSFTGPMWILKCCGCWLWHAWCWISYWLHVFENCEY